MSGRVECSKSAVSLSCAGAEVQLHSAGLVDSMLSPAGRPACWPQGANKLQLKLQCGNSLLQPQVHAWGQHDRLLSTSASQDLRLDGATAKRTCTRQARPRHRAPGCG